MPDIHIFFGCYDHLVAQLYNTINAHDTFKAKHPGAEVPSVGLNFGVDE